MSPTVAACQIAVEDAEVASNLATVCARVEGLPGRTDLAVFPEYALTGSPDGDRIARAPLARDASEIGELRDLAAREGTALVVGFLEDADSALYNALAYVPPDEDPTYYRKRHRWDREREWVEAGEARVTVETPAGTAGLLTCYDLNFVEESAALAREGIDLLLVAGAWPATHSENWTLLCRARAIDGVRWVVAAGRTGTGDGDAEYAGRSIVARPDGGVHAQLDRREDDLVTDLDPGILKRQRELVGIFDGG